MRKRKANSSNPVISNRKKHSSPHKKYISITMTYIQCRDRLCKMQVVFLPANNWGGTINSLSKTRLAGFSKNFLFQKYPAGFF